MRRWITSGALAVALAALGATGAALAGGVKDTDLINDTFIPVSDDSSRSIFVGHVESPSAKCVKNRKIKVTFIFTMTDYVSDHVRSGQKGGFAGIGPNTHNGNPLFA